MEILVCIKRVPDTSENEINVNRDGTDIERDDLVYSVNEWDNYAVEEAIQIRDRVGGSVTVVTVGDEEAEEVVRREMAMGADKGILLLDQVFNGSDGRGIASIIAAEVEPQKRAHSPLLAAENASESKNSKLPYGRRFPAACAGELQKGKYDLILTGAQADDGAGQVGGMLAAMLDRPYASLVTSLEVIDDKKIKVGREIEGGNVEMLEIDLPCVLSIQTGINEPRYVGIRGIRKTASVEIPVYGAEDLGLSPESVGESGSRVKRLDYFMPDSGEGAEILEGSTDEIVGKLVELLKARGGIK